MNRLFVFSLIVFSGLFFDRLNIFKIYLLSTVLHETGHVFAYRLFTNKMPYIDISAFGYKMYNNVLHNKFYILILLRGPVTNFIIAAFALILINYKGTFTVYIWFFVNFLIFIFNILPVYFLDGGQVLYCLSPFYQRNYVIISIFTVLIISVMVYSFTGVSLSFALFLIYFIINMLNDI